MDDERKELVKQFVADAVQSLVSVGGTAVVLSSTGALSERGLIIWAGIFWLVQFAALSFMPNAIEKMLTMLFGVLFLIIASDRAKPAPDLVGYWYFGSMFFGCILQGFLFRR